MRHLPSGPDEVFAADSRAPPARARTRAWRRARRTRGKRRGGRLGQPAVMPTVGALGLPLHETCAGTSVWVLPVPDPVPAPVPVPVVVQTTLSEATVALTRVSIVALLGLDCRPLRRAVAGRRTAGRSRRGPDATAAHTL